MGPELEPEQGLRPLRVPQAWRELEAEPSRGHPPVHNGWQLPCALPWLAVSDGLPMCALAAGRALELANVTSKPHDATWLE